MLSEPMPCAKVASGQRWDPQMHMDVDEVAYPEGHTLWDKVGARAPRGQDDAGRARRVIFKAQHKLVLQACGLSARPATGRHWLQRPAAVP